MTDKTELISQIRLAFKGAKPPKIVADRAFALDRPFEVGYLSGTFGRKTWEAIASETLLQSASMLIYMTEEAYCYYLPAYLMLLLDYDTSDFAGRVIVDMFAKDSENPQQASTVSRLSKKQKQVVLEIFDYLHTLYDYEDIPAPCYSLHS